MAALLRETIATVALASALPALIRHFATKKSGTILVYHDPKPDVFEKHMEYVARRYRFIPLATLVDALHSGDWSTVPPHAVVVTFDDGHRGNHALLPIFKRFNIRPTIYVCSQIIGSLRHYWFCDLTYAAGIYLQALPQAERLAILQKEYGHTPMNEYPEESRQSLSDSEIAEMAPHVDFQGHSRFHPILTALSDEECRNEIADCRREVSSKVGRPCEHFAFPDGDYTRRELEILKAGGYRSARSMDMGWNKPGGDPYRLKVTGLTDDASVRVLAVQLTGIPMWLRRARHGRFDGRHITLIFEPTRKYQ